MKEIEKEKDKLINRLRNEKEDLENELLAAQKSL